MRFSHVALLAAAVAVLPACGSSSSSPNSPAPPATQAPVPAPPPTQAPAPQAPSATGSWLSEARDWRMDLTQQGSTISGRLVGFGRTTYSNPDHPDLQIRGTVSSAGLIEFAATAFSFGFTGRMEPDGRSMRGTTFDCAANGGCRNYGEVMLRQ